MQLTRWHIEIGDRVKLHDGRTGRIFDIDPTYLTLGCGCCTEQDGWEIWIEMDEGGDDEIIKVAYDDEIEEIAEIL